MIADARHLNLIAEYADYSNTYSVDYGRVCGWVEPDGIEELRTLRNTIVKLAEIEPNGKAWRAASRTYNLTARTYAAAHSVTMTEVAIRVRG